MLPLSFIQLVVGVTVVMHPCPYVPAAHDGYGHTIRWSCVDLETKTIWLAKQDRPWSIRQLVLGHEYGHLDDYWRLTSSDRQVFKRLMGYKPRRGWWQDKPCGRPLCDAPAETYAEWFGECAVGLRRLTGGFCRYLPPADP